MNVSIAGLDKADVLRVLYNRARPLGMGILHYTPEDMTAEQAHELLKASTYFDYVKGRVMKVRIEGNLLDPRLYDRDNGEGAANTAIQTLRA